MCYSIDKPWKHAKSKKPDSKSYAVCFHFFGMSRIDKSLEAENRLSYSYSTPPPATGTYFPSEVLKCSKIS